MKQYRVTCENTTRNVGWFDDKKQAVTFCKKKYFSSKEWWCV